MIGIILANMFFHNKHWRGLNRNWCICMDPNWVTKVDSDPGYMGSVAIEEKRESD